MKKGEVMSADQIARMTAGIKAAWIGERGEHRREAARLRVDSAETREKKSAAQRERYQNLHVEAVCTKCGDPFSTTMSKTGRRRQCPMCLVSRGVHVERNITCVGCGKDFTVSGARLYVEGRMWCSSNCGSRLAKWSDESRRGMSLRVSKQWADPEFKAAVGRKISTAKKGQKPAPQTIVARVASVRAHGVSDSTREKHRKWCIENNWGHADKPLHAEAAVAKMQQTRASQVEVNRANGQRLMDVWSGHWCEWLDRKGRLVKFRSSWEMKLAQRLDVLELTWEHEAHRLLLSDGRVYIPDFWVSEWDSYVEVKGWRGWGCPEKVDIARADGHSVILLSSLSAIATIDHAGVVPADITELATIKEGL